MNSSVGAWAPPEAGMYCPVLLSLACSWPVTSTIGLVPGPDSRPGAPVTCGSLVKIVTAVPGCQVRLASWVRYCLATPKSSATMALASRKYLTTSSGLQPGCGGRTSSPQQGPAPGGGAGAEAGCGPLPEGMTEHPPTSVTAAASPVTRAAQPRGRRAAARRGSGIAAPGAGAALGGIGHGVHGDDAVGPGYLGVVGAQRQRGPDKLPAHRARQGEPEDRAPPLLPPGLQPAGVQPGVLQGDGQAQPGPAGGPGPGWVGPPETI